MKKQNIDVLTTWYDTKQAIKEMGAYTIAIVEFIILDKIWPVEAKIGDNVTHQHQQYYKQHGDHIATYVKDALFYMDEMIKLVKHDIIVAPREEVKFIEVSTKKNKICIQDQMRKLLEAIDRLIIDDLLNPNGDLAIHQGLVRIKETDVEHPDQFFIAYRDDDSLCIGAMDAIYFLLQRFDLVCNFISSEHVDELGLKSLDLVGQILRPSTPLAIDIDAEASRESSCTLQSKRVKRPTEFSEILRKRKMNSYRCLLYSNGIRENRFMGLDNTIWVDDIMLVHRPLQRCVPSATPMLQSDIQRLQKVFIKNKANPTFSARTKLFTQAAANDIVYNVQRLQSGDHIGSTEAHPQSKTPDAGCYTFFRKKIAQIKRQILNRKESERQEDKLCLQEEKSWSGSGQRRTF